MRSPPVSGALLWASWAALVWERAWPELWPVAALTAAFTSLGLLGLLPFGPTWLRWLVWSLQLVAILGTAAIGARRIAWPSRSEVLRAIEAASGLQHRPLSQVGTLAAAAGDDPLTRSLWAVHRRRLAGSIGRLRPPSPRARVAARDPYALRAAALLVLVVGAVVAGPMAGDRLLRLVLPPSGAAATAAGITAELWFTPPDYTGLSPLYIDSTAQSQGEVAVPTGARLLVQVHGADSTPVLRIDSTQRLLEGRGDKEYALTQVLPNSARLELRADGVTVLALPLRMVMDTPPGVIWSHPPRRTAHGALDLRYKATDDYGVAALDLAVTPLDPRTMKPRDAETAHFRGALPSPPVRQVNGELFEDLTSSPSAGLPASLRLVVHDAIGQRGESPAVVVMLPERVFRNPVARAIIAARKTLAQSPDKAGEVAATLDALSLQPESYRNDLRVFLALRVAVRQLATDVSTASRAAVGSLLWRAAIRVEDGAAGQAEQDMRAAESALRDAAARHASAAEIHRLTEALRQAIAKYLQAMLQNGQKANQAAGDPGAGKSVTTDQIEAMLERAEALARAGDQAGADAEMAKLQRLMESLQFSTPQNAAESQSLHDVSEIAREQQRQLDRTTQNQNAAEDKKGAPGASTEEGKAQAALHDRLESLRRQLGQAGLPGAADLDRAGQAMSAAAKALKSGARGPAIPAQARAVESLRSAAQSMAQAMRGHPGAGTAENVQEDPLGRRREDGHSPEGEDIDLPTDPTVTQSRRILDELRRRQGDLERPQLERDYIDRLLQNF